MKKIVLTVCFAAVTMVAFAQLPTFGIKGGINFARYQIPGYPGGTKTSNALTTFNGGIFVDFKFGNVSLQPALNYTGKGGKYNENVPLFDNQGNNIGNTNISSQEKLYYLELPVNVIYHIPFIIGNIYFGIGPYIAQGISGNSTYSGPGGNGNIASESVKIYFGNNEGDIKSTQFGADAIAGLKFKNGFLVNFNYDLGLSNDIPSGDGYGGKSKSRVFGLSIGYAL